MENKILLANATWHSSVLGIYCPKCGEWNDYWEQFRDHESPFEICRSTDRNKLKGIKWKCLKCEIIFELGSVEFEF